MPRQARLDKPGTLHHVIIRGIEKKPIVDDVKDKKGLFLRQGGLLFAGWSRKMEYPCRKLQGVLEFLPLLYLK